MCLFVFTYIKSNLKKCITDHSLTITLTGCLCDTFKFIRLLRQVKVNIALVRFLIV